MRILLIAGKDMKVGSTSKFWSLALLLTACGHEVRVKECIETGTGANKVTAADVQWAEGFIVYSWGTASLWHLWHSLGALKAAKLLVIIAGVPDFGLAQLHPTLWHAPAVVERAVCFDVCDIPTSCTLQNAGAEDIDYGQAIPAARHVNVNCGNLFPPFALPGQKHIRIIEKDEVIREVVAVVGDA